MLSETLNKESKSDFDPKDLLTAIISKIKAINSGEDESSSELTFTGMIRLMTKIIENFDISICEEIVIREGLIEEIFVKLIFKSVFEEGEKKTSKSPSYGLKAASFKLIMYLVKSSPKLMSAFLKDCFAKLTDKFRRRTEWNYIPPQQSAAAAKEHKFVGLRNLGCICYMNAIMQQFFHIPAFRYQLLSVDDGLPQDIQEYKGKKIDDNVLHQL